MKPIITLFILLASVGTSLAQYIPTNGLIASYPFNGNADDASGNNYNMTANGPALCTDRYLRPNKAYQFDGIDDYIKYSTTLPQGTDFTLSFWYRSDISQRGDIINNGDGNVNGIGILQYGGITQPSDTGNKIAFYCGGIAYHYDVANIENIWHHVVLRLTGGNYDYFFDNSLVNSGSFTINPPSGFFYMGAGGFFTNNYPFKGRIDDIAVYNRAITNTEVDTLFHGCGPQIVVQPVNTTVVENSQVKFSVQGLNTVSYLWQMDLGAGFANLSATSFPGANSDTVTVNFTNLSLNNAKFRVVVYNDINCKDTSNVATLTITPLSTDETLLQKVVRIYPNPSNGFFTVNLGNVGIKAGVVVSISDLQGRSVYKTQTQTSVAEIKTNLCPGVYVLHLKTANGQVLGDSKLVIQ